MDKGSHGALTKAGERNQAKNLIDEAVAFVHRLAKLLLEKRDDTGMLASFGPDISWISTGAHETFCGLKEAQEYLARDVADFPGRFTITNCPLKGEILSFSPALCVVHGEIFANSNNVELVDFYARLTVVCEKNGAEFRALHLHISRPDLNQDDEHYYVRRAVEEKRRTLQRRMDEIMCQLSHRNAELEALTSNIPGGVHQCMDDPDFTLLSMSEAFLLLLGYSREEIRDCFNNSLAALILPEDRAQVQLSLRSQLQTADTAELEYRIKHKDGRVLWILDKRKLIVYPDGLRVLFGVMLDISAQRKERDALRLSLERHQVILDQSSDIIFEWDFVEDSLSLSANWRKKYGYDPIRTNISQNIPPSGDIHFDDVPVLLDLMTQLQAGAPYGECEVRIRGGSGYVWSRLRATTQYNVEKRPIKAVGVILDIDVEKKKLQELEEQAWRDPLTGLLNKAAGQSRVVDLLRSSARQQGVFLILDLDDFKQINDLFGHLSGDAVLSDVGGELTRLFRASDVTARIGGDEFMIYMPGMGVEEASKKAHALINAVSAISIFGRTGLVRCSVGAALFPEDATNFQALYHCADMALYHVKNFGKRDVAFYSPERDLRDKNGIMTASALGAPIDSEGRLIQNKLAAYCFSMLYHAMHPETAVRQMLDIVGRANNVSRVYIFESSEDGLTCSNTFEWCNTGIASEMKSLQNLNYQELADYLSHFNENGVFYCADVSALSEPLRGVLTKQGIRSLLQCAIRDDGEFKGFVGFDDCIKGRAWTEIQAETLSMVANVLSTFLLKLRLKERVQHLENQLEACREKNGQ